MLSRREDGRAGGRGDEGGGDEKLNGKICSAARGSGCGARACTSSAACGQNRAKGAGRTGRAPAELSSAIRDAASLFAFIFRFASTGEAERHDVTY